MIMKKIASILLACAMLTALLAGCSESHTHQTADTWEVDLTNHWKTCTDCGEIVEQAAHTLNEDNICTVCGAQIVDWGESKSLWQYNDKDDMIRSIDYDLDGNVTTETVYTYEYNADGLMTASKTTIDGTLAEESTYRVVDGESVVSQYISYADDGTKFTNDYDEYGNVVLLVSYDAEGNETSRNESEYAQTTDGEWYECWGKQTEQDGTVYVGTYNENGDQIGWIWYDADGTVVLTKTWEYTYDNDGNRQTMKFYCDDVLKEEMIYKTVTTEDGSTTYPETVTEYHEDGTTTVTNYDENGEPIS